jgi:hypothetical protein
MNQLNLFEDDSQEITIPSDVISPLESTDSPKSKKFKRQQKRWAEYVRPIQDYHNCNWNDARNLLIKHRHEQTPVKTNFN